MKFFMYMHATFTLTFQSLTLIPLLLFLRDQSGGVKQRSKKYPAAQCNSGLLFFLFCTTPPPFRLFELLCFAFLCYCSEGAWSSR